MTTAKLRSVCLLKRMSQFAIAGMLILSLVGACLGDTLPRMQTKSVSSSEATPTILTSPASNSRGKPLSVTQVPIVTTSSFPTTKGNARTTKMYAESTMTTARYAITRAHVKTKAEVTSENLHKSNFNSSAFGVTSEHTAPRRLQERLGAIDCDLPVLPSESRLWRGNETHELRLPVTTTEECNGGSEEECPPVIQSWEGAADIQAGDVLIVRIADPAPLDVVGSNHLQGTNESKEASRVNRALPQPAVYQVTRQGHEHCDVSDGMLLDITPLDENGSKIITLYDKDLTEGVNLLIVVSESWRSRCVRLKVTVKSDNCGDTQDCSGKGVCYTNVSMESYECQCCRSYVGPHCEERDPCSPAPCLNHGICIIVNNVNTINYHCLCPYGFTGTKCEKDACHSSPCLNGGSCMSMAMNRTAAYHCVCPPGWVGSNCELPAAGGACSSNPCVNGICVEQVDNDVDRTSYRCFCQPGYTGVQCELEYNECESSPCANGGTCTDRVAGYECACTRGYTGKNCQHKVDLCSSNACSPQQFCIDHGNTYSCECPRGFVGEDCHIPTRSPCDNNPCAHGGTCWTGVNTFFCSCRPGFTGKLCETDFILETVVSNDIPLNNEPRSGGSVREVRGSGLYHDRLHNVYIAAGTLGAAIAIVGVVVTACHCRVNKTYARVLSRLSRVTEAGPPHHWLQDKRTIPPPTAPFQPPTTNYEPADMYYTLDFSDSQSSPLIQ